MSEETIFPRETPLLPLFHGSAALPAKPTCLQGLPYTTTITASGLRVEDADGPTHPLVYATNDPLYALGYTLHRRLPSNAGMIFSLNYEAGVFENHIVFFTLKDENGRDVTYDEWGHPVVLFKVEPCEGKTFLNTNHSFNLSNEWIIAGEAKAEPIAVFRNLLEIAAAGIQIYTMDGTHVDMKRRSVAERQTDWDETKLPFSLWSKMMGNYTYPYSEDKAMRIRSDFLDPHVRAEMLHTGLLTHLNPLLAGPLPQDSFAPRIAEIRQDIVTVFRRLYWTGPQPD